MVQKSTGILIAIIAIGGILLLGVGIGVGLFAAGTFANHPESIKPQPAQTVVKPIKAETVISTLPTIKPPNAEIIITTPPAISEEKQLRQDEIRKWSGEVNRLNAAIEKAGMELKNSEKQTESRFMVKRRFGDELDRGVYECFDASTFRRCAVIADPESIKSQFGQQVKLTVKSLGERKTTVTKQNAFREWTEEEYIDYFEQVPNIDREKLKAESDALNAELKIAKFNVEHPERAFLRTRQSNPNCSGLMDCTGNKYSARVEERAVELLERVLEKCMSVTNHVKPEWIALKNHPELNERWVQSIIADDPSLLGLGKLILKDKERIHPQAGRLDLLLQDADSKRRNEAKIKLGKTNELHVIRAIGYRPPTGVNPLELRQRLSAA